MAMRVRGVRGVVIRSGRGSPAGMRSDMTAPRFTVDRERLASATRADAVSGKVTSLS